VVGGFWAGYLEFHLQALIFSTSGAKALTAAQALRGAEAPLFAVTASSLQFF
jgi:hypothetical protein